LGTISGLRTIGIETTGISKGSVADISLLGLDRSHSWPQNDPLSNVIYSSSSSDVTDLIVNGKVVYLDKKHQTLDKEKIIEKCSSISSKILTEMKK
jgi:cytosine/adenosine deaminase-related metal-dependent hydrolase